MRLGPRQHRPEPAELQRQQAAYVAEQQRLRELAEAPSRDAGFSLLLDEEEEVYWEPADPIDSGNVPSAVFDNGVLLVEAWCALCFSALPCFAIATSEQQL